MAVQQITSQLSPGMSGSQVQQLQQFLNSMGFLVAPAGQPGGPGSETDYFGPATQAALQKFQASYGLVSSGDPTSTGYGNFGPQTMKMVNQLISSGAVAAMPSNPQPAAPQPLNNGQSSTPGASGTNNQPGTSAPSSQTSSNGATGYSISSGSGTPMFNGDYALVRVSGEGYTPNQLFLVDTADKQLIPFSSDQAAQNFFNGASMDQINASTVTVPSSVLSSTDPSALFGGYQVLGSKYAVSSDGTIPNQPPSNANIADRYGQQIDQGAETQALQALDGFVNLLQSGAAGSSNVSKQELTKIMSDPTQVAFYVNALAYGGYSLQQVYQDMVRVQYSDNGQASSVANSIPISAATPASQYASDPHSQQSTNNPLLNVSPTIAGLDSSVLSLPIFQMPTAAFSQLTPLTNPDSPQFQAEMAKYTDATYEVALEMAQASNDSEHQQAQADWTSLQQEIQGRLGITLSDNAVTAFNQLQNFQAQASMNNLAGSGMADQQIAAYLKQQQSVNQSMRQYYQTYQDQAQENYYQNYASPDEVNALISSDPQRAQAWGLTPNDATKQYLTLSNLQSLFPNVPQSQLQGLINKYLDTNGNFYSKLYGNYAANNYDTNQQYGSWKANQVITKAQNDAQTALSQYDNPSNPFLRGTTTVANPTGQTPSANADNASQVSKTNAQGALNPSAYSSLTNAVKSLTNTGTQTTTPQSATPTTTPSTSKTQSTGSQTTPSIPAPQSTNTGSPASQFPTLTGATTPAKNNSSLGAGLSISPTGQVTNNFTPNYTPPAPAPKTTSPLVTTSGGSSGGGLFGWLGNAAKTVANWF